MKKICLAAILRDEEPFLDEWLIYHKMVGIDHFFLYDDGPELPLQKFLQPHEAYVTVIPWHKHIQNESMDNTRQTQAYRHAVAEYGAGFEWITFIDGDEFIVLRKHKTINDFLAEFSEYASISLHWHVFGHGGFYDDPPGLVTASLLRRSKKPHHAVKSITRPEAIADIKTAHECILKDQKRVDANKNMHGQTIYEGISDVAHINHYQCRSFKRWMQRTKRGAVSCDFMDKVPDDATWRVSEEQCLKRFVTTVAVGTNEMADPYMKKYTAAILYRFMKMGIKK